MEKRRTQLLGEVELYLQVHTLLINMNA